MTIDDTGRGQFTDAVISPGERKGLHLAWGIPGSPTMPSPVIPCEPEHRSRHAPASDCLAARRGFLGLAESSSTHAPPRWFTMLGGQIAEAS